MTRKHKILGVKKENLDKLEVYEYYWKVTGSIYHTLSSIDNRNMLLGRDFRALGTNPRYKPATPSRATIPASTKV